MPASWHGNHAGANRTRGGGHTLEHAPEHACAILTDPAGRLLLQLRPAWARHAAGQLVCFGGKRHPDEDAEACLRRELAEELGWCPAELAPALELRRGSRWIARFCLGRVPAGTALRTEPGFQAVWAPWQALPGLPLSPWHRSALDAWRSGQGAAEV